MHSSGESVSFEHDHTVDMFQQFGDRSTHSKFGRDSESFFPPPINHPSKGLMGNPFGMMPNRFSRNDITRMTARRNLSVVHAASNRWPANFDGFPQIVECDFPISLREANRRKYLPVPSLYGSFVVGTPNNFRNPQEVDSTLDTSSTKSDAIPPKPETLGQAFAKAKERQAERERTQQAASSKPKKKRHSRKRKKDQ